MTVPLETNTYTEPFPILSSSNLTVRMHSEVCRRRHHKPWKRHSRALALLCLPTRLEQTQAPAFPNSVSLSLSLARSLFSTRYQPLKQNFDSSVRISLPQRRDKRMVRSENEPSQQLLYIFQYRMQASK